MSEKNMKDLKAEATALGIEFKGNVSRVKLSEMIENHYESQAAGDFVEAVEDDTETDIEVEIPKTRSTTMTDKKKRFNSLVSEAKKKAFKTKIVTVSSIDKRDNDVTTAEPIMFENQYFGISKIVPLDIPIELEQCLIDILESTKIILHVDEIIDGKRTGNKTPRMVRKFSVSYAES